MSADTIDELPDSEEPKKAIWWWQFNTNYHCSFNNLRDQWRGFILSSEWYGG
jgi:hypothetical protein